MYVCIQARTLQITEANIKSHFMYTHFVKF